MKKPLAALVIAKLGKKKSSPEPEVSGEDDSMEEEGSEGLQAAGEEVMSALESGDKQGFVEALKAFVDQC